MTYGSQANQGLMPIIQRPPANEVHFDDSQAVRVVSAGVSQRVDRQAKAMSTITREEFNAKLEAMEAKMDGRVARIEGKIDAFLVRAEGSEKVMLVLSEKAASAADRASGLQSTLWITSITTVLTVFAIAIAAYFANQQSNISIAQTTISAFELGKSHSVSTAPEVPMLPPVKR